MIRVGTTWFQLPFYGLLHVQVIPRHLWSADLQAHGTVQVNRYQLLPTDASVRHETSAVIELPEFSILIASHWNTLFSWAVFQQEAPTSVFLVPTCFCGVQKKVSLLTIFDLGAEDNTTTNCVFQKLSALTISETGTGSLAIRPSILPMLYKRYQASTQTLRDRLWHCTVHFWTMLLSRLSQQLSAVTWLIFQSLTLVVQW